jgi:hypothetical protein
LVRALEVKFGGVKSFPILEPFPCSILEHGEPNILAIQSAAKVIATHSGLSDLTFAVAITNQPPDIAGHIELRYGSLEVFIELSRDIFCSRDSVLATLSHKFLHMHGLRYGETQLEQELLTDVTAVYLGMGKLMLNGCEWYSFSSVSRQGKTAKTIRTLRTGYLQKNGLPLYIG